MAKKYILVFAFILSAGFVSASGKAGGKLTERGKSFIRTFTPVIESENHKILKKRHYILWLKWIFYNGGYITLQNQAFLKQTAAEYDFEDYEIRNKTFRKDVLAAMDGLLERVDVVPERIVLAQAIIETAWGKSSAARETNNYFGITCRCSKGRLVTSSGTVNYYLKSYDTLEEGIADFISLLNTKRSYKKFRELRAELRENQQPLKEEVLTSGLTRYSELGNVYVAKVNHVMRKYLMSDYRALAAK